MFSTTEIIFISTIVIALIAKFFVTSFQAEEKAEQEAIQRTISNILSLKKRLHPGTYTFTWKEERMMAPEVASPDEAHPYAINFRYIVDEVTIDSLESLPRDYQLELEELIKEGLSEDQS